MSIKLELSVEEVNQVLAVLGDQPIKSGLAGLTSKIKAQGDAQLVVPAQVATAAADAVDVVDVVDATVVSS